MTLRTLRQHPGQRGGPRWPSTTLGQIGRHPDFRPLPQGEFGPIAVQREFLHHGAHRVRPHQRLHRTIGPQHQQPSWPTAPGHIRQPLDGRRITPVQVLQHQDTGPVRGEHFHRLDQLPQHALPCRPSRIPLQRLSVLGDRSAGSWSNQLGACWRRRATRCGPSGLRPICPSAARSGR